MKKESSKEEVLKNDKLSFFQKYKWAFIPMFFAIALYFNTLNHGFVLDDNIIFQSKSITSGFKELPTLLTEKTLPEAENIKPYRPVTSLSFAFDYQFFKNDNDQKMASNLHKMNVLYYGLALFFTFILVLKLFKNRITALAISLLFAAHPIHTEVVANIKSRDEILAYLFGTIMLILYIKFKELHLKKYLYYSLAFYFLAILSKESAILLLAILPAIDYFLNSEKGFKMTYFSNLKWFIFPAILYLVLQRIIIGINLMPKMSEIDNMLVGIPNFSENLATRIYIVGLYLYKMLVPHPLFYDYTLNYISKKTFASFEVWISLVAIISLVYLIFKGIIQKNKVAFGLFFMFITFALTCNLFIAIGATFAERFAFTPSLGFVIALVFLLYSLIDKFKMKQVYLLLFIVPILSLYSFKTIARNANWKDNETLFTHDYLQSSKSLKIQNNYGAILYYKAKASTDSIERKKLFLKSIEVLDKVTNTYDTYIEAYIQKGVSYLEIKNCEKALINFEKAKSIAVYNPVVEANLGIGYINCGKPQEAVTIFSKLLNYDKSKESYYLKHIGVAHFNIKNLDSAEYYFSRLKNDYPNDTEVDGYIKLVSDYKNGTNSSPTQTTSTTQNVDATQNAQFDAAYKLFMNGDKNGAEKALLEFIKSNPSHAMAQAVLGLIADEQQNFPKAIRYYKKSIAINPTDYRIHYNLGNSYLKNKNDAEAIKQFEKCIAIEPKYIKSYKSLELYYKSVNNVQKQNYYTQKIKELEGK
ncbi:tetratricopeptide repeat protein [Flavobacterium sp.]|uniref:tetratricopeptide repeat protein n=1 Tax=Flavobacterium sp. TaxID=239 RepID=UPI0026021FFF|nr:tetratricopeptide repeat protein [Flavobacterium sp.]